MTRRLRTALALPAAIIALGLPACERIDDQASAAPASWVLTTQPASAIAITNAKTDAKEGDTVTLRGIIGGAMEPISDESSVFRVIDTGLENACVAEDDHCATPWDYCCAMPEDIKANSATVVIVDESGQTIDQSPSTQGFEPLDEVIVVGTVGPRPSPDVLTVRATGIYKVNG